MGKYVQSGMEEWVAFVLVAGCLDRGMGSGWASRPVVYVCTQDSTEPDDDSSSGGLAEVGG